MRQNWNRLPSSCQDPHPLQTTSQVYLFTLQFPEATERDDLVIAVGSDVGALLVDGLGDGIMLEASDQDFDFLHSISFNLLQDPSGEFCQEKRVLYKLILGLHSSISFHIASDYLLDEAKYLWGPNLTLLYDRVLQHPDRVRNLYFTFLFVLRAVTKIQVNIYQYLEAFFPKSYLYTSTLMTKTSRACSHVVVLRLLAFAITATATIVIAMSHQTTTFFNFTLDAKFQYTPAFN